jgi:hypothetical protein
MRFVMKVKQVMKVNDEKILINASPNTDCKF